MRARALSATLFSIVLVALPACSSETSIVLVVKAGDDVAKTVEQVDVYVGTGTVTPVGVDGEARWWDRATLVMEPSSLVFPEGLADGRYELLIRSTDALPPDAELMFAAVGRAEDPNPDDHDPGPLRAFAASDDDIAFASGQVRRIVLPLRTAAFDARVAGVTASDCVWWNHPGAPPAEKVRQRAIVPPGDRDCDGFLAGAATTTCPTADETDCDGETDCDDANPGISPAAAPGCVGNNDCCCDTVDMDDADNDGQPDCEDCADDNPFEQSGTIETCDGINTGCAPTPLDTTTSRPCGVPVADGCHLGRQFCNETANGRPSFDMCVAEAAGPDLPLRVCTLCNDPTGATDCRDVRVLGGCGVRTSPEGSSTACVAPVQQVPLPVCPAAECTWLIDGVPNQNGWSVSLVDADDTTPGASPAPTFRGTEAALRVITVGAARHVFLIRRSIGPNIGPPSTLDVVGLERSLDPQCEDVVCMIGGN